MEEVTLNSRLVMRKAPWQHARDEVTVLWTVPDRGYLLHGTLSRSFAIAGRQRGAVST